MVYRVAVSSYWAALKKKKQKTNVVGTTQACSGFPSSLRTQTTCYFQPPQKIFLNILKCHLHTKPQLIIISSLETGMASPLPSSNHPQGHTPPQTYGSSSFPLGTPKAPRNQQPAFQKLIINPVHPWWQQMSRTMTLFQNPLPGTSPARAKALDDRPLVFRGAHGYKELTQGKPRASFFWTLDPRAVPSS